MADTDPEVIRQYHAQRVKEMAEALLRTDVKPEAVEQAAETLKNGAKKIAEVKSESCARAHTIPSSRIGSCVRVCVRASDDPPD